jgi:FkbM family methyltransferase
MSIPSLTTGLEGINELTICRNGLMLINRNDTVVGASLRRYGEFSPGENRLFRQKIAPGMTVLEIGANIGAHTVGLSQMVGPGGVVHAFEPQRLVFQILCANLALNSCTNVYARQIAVGEAAVMAHVPAFDPRQPSNFGGVSMLLGRAGEEVQVLPLDAFKIATCHLMKIDVEGMEPAVLRGARKTIAQHRPLLYVENDRPGNSAEVIGLLLEYSYRIYWHLPPLYEPDNFRGDPVNIFPGICSINLVCVPTERQQEATGLPDVTGPDDDWHRLLGSGEA